MRLSPHLVLLLIALALVGSKCDVRASYGDPPPSPPEGDEDEGSDRTEGGFRLAVRVGDSHAPANAAQAARAAAPAAPSPAPPLGPVAVPLAGPGSYLAGLLCALLGARRLSRRPVPVGSASSGPSRARSPACAPSD